MQKLLKFIGSNKFLYILIALTLLVNVALLTRYRTENIDEAWSLSFYYNYTHKGIETDTVFQSNDGQAGVLYFGKVIAVVYSAVFDVIGWNRLNVGLVGLILVIAAAFCWYKVILKLYGDKKFALNTFLLFILLEPFIANINSARGEALILLLTGASLLLLLNKQYVIGVLLAAISLETHPVGGIAGITLLTYLFTAKPKLGKWGIAQIVIATIASAIGYLALHSSALASLLAFLTSNSKTGWTNLFVQYFFQAQYKRHLLELAVIILSGVIFIQKKLFKTYSFIFVLAIINLLLLALFPRPNINYVALFSLGIWLIVALVSSKDRFYYLVVPMLAAIVLGQYAYLIRQNLNHNYDNSVVQVTKLLPNPNLPVVGSSNEWFVFKDKNFYAATISDKIPVGTKEFYLIQENDYRTNSTFKDYVSTSCSLEKLQTETIQQELFQSYLAKCN